MQYTPRKVVVHEENPPSVVEYTVELRQTDGLTFIARKAFAADGNQNQDLSIGLTGGVIPDISNPIPLLGTQVTVFVKQKGPDGTETLYQQAPGGPWTVNELPDGSESLTVVP